MVRYLEMHSPIIGQFSAALYTVLQGRAEAKGNSYFQTNNKNGNEVCMQSKFGY